MLVKSLLKEELDRLQRLGKRIYSEIQDLPKGSISQKKRKNNNYYYWAWREGNKIIFQYIGKEGTSEVIEAKKQRQIQKDLNERLKSIKQQIRELENLLGESQ